MRAEAVVSVQAGGLLSRFGVRIDLGHTDWMDGYLLYYRCAAGRSFPGKKFWTTHVIGSEMSKSMRLCLVSHG